VPQVRFHPFSSLPKFPPVNDGTMLDSMHLPSSGNF
jgi:hypothetical protein